MIVYQYDILINHLLWEQGVEGSNPFTPTKKSALKLTFFV